MRNKVIPFIVILLGVTSLNDIYAVEKKIAWTPEVMLTTKAISDVQLSPGNDSILFVVTEAKMGDEKGSFVTRIYKRDFDQESLNLLSEADSITLQPRWSPDGKWIAFLSVQEGVKNLYLIASRGGDARPLTNYKRDVQTFCWSPDGEKIAYVMSDEIEIEKNRKKSSLACVYNQKTQVNRLWLLENVFVNPTYRSLTTDEYCVRGCGDFNTTNAEFDWSPDSTKITFAYSQALGFEGYFLDSHLATVDIASGDVRPWDVHAKFEALPRYSPDGLKVAFLRCNSQERYSLDWQVAIRSSEGKDERLLSSTFNEGAYIAGPNLLGWDKEGSHLLYYEPKGTRFHLVLLPLDGGPPKEVETGNIFFEEPALSYDKTMLGCVVQTTATPPEVFVGEINHFIPVQISKVNDQLLSYPKTRTEVVSWISQDGLQIEGLLTYPMGYEESRKYPLLLVIHGGPMGFFRETFVGTPHPYPIACFAESGFFIFRPNPRGSSGYGKKFRSANYRDFGGGDFIDIMSGVDVLIGKGMVDPERLGVMGWSYGGYMTAWTITQTSRFKAASMGAGICNLISMNGTTDLHKFLTDYLGDFAIARELYEERSPIYYAERVTTPCLIQHGTEDKRVPISQAQEFYHALDRLGKEATFVLYPGMGHRLTDPNMLLDAMQCNLTWFREYLEADRK